MDRSGRQVASENRRSLRAGGLKDGRHENVRMNGSLLRGREYFLNMYRSYVDNPIRYRTDRRGTTAVMVWSVIVVPLITPVVMR